MYLYSIIVFLAICYGFGYLATFFVKNSEHFFERHLMRIGIGLGTFVSVGYLLNLLHIPLDYRVFFGVITAGAFTAFAHRYRKHKTFFLEKPTFNINIYTVGMIVLFCITFYMYHTGAFSYPYLENDDPWGHAIGTKYVATEKTAFSPEGGGLRYIDPYPPAYDLVMGVIHQTNDSVYWTLKFFNSLIISLSIVFFYFFSRQLTSSSKKAFFSTFILFAVPAFMSHFIWSISLTMPLFFASFYCLERIREEKLWMIPSALVTMAALTSSASHSVYFGVFLGIYLGMKTIAARKFIWSEYAGAVGGLSLSLVLWWLPSFFKHGVQGILSGIGAQGVPLLGIAGTADRQYILSDFTKVTSQNMINNPVGFGLAVSLLFCVCILFMFFSNRHTLFMHMKYIFLTFSALFGAILLVLSHSYIKYVPKRDQPELTLGSVPFLEFVGDQFFLILTLGTLLFLFVIIAWRTWTDPDFKEWWIILAFAWGAFSFYAVMASTFHYKLSPFRAWMLFAIPFSLLAGEGMSLLHSLLKGLFRKTIPLTTSILPFVILIPLFYFVYTTSFIPKFEVNTAQWSPGGFWTSSEEIQGYIWIHQNLPPNTPLFTFSNSALVVAFDKFFCHWCQDDRTFQKNGFNLSPEEISSTLKRKNYDHLIIDGQAARRFGVNETNNKIQSLLSSGYFEGIFSNNAIILMKIT